MWKLLFAERKYVPLPRSWHVYHFVLALVGPGCAWLLLSLTKRHMEANGAAHELEARKKREAEEAIVEAQEEKKKQAFEALSEQVAELKKEVHALQAAAAAASDKIVGAKD